MAPTKPGWPAVPSLPLTVAQRAQLWALLISSGDSATIWRDISNQVPQNYIKTFPNPGAYLSAPAYSSMSDNNPLKVQVYAYDAALQNTYASISQGKQPQQVPPGGTAPGQGGDIGGANPGFGKISGPWWLDFKRIGMFVAGAALMGVAVNAALRNQMGRGAPQLPGPKQIVKTARKLPK